MATMAGVTIVAGLVSANQAAQAAKGAANEQVFAADRAAKERQTQLATAEGRLQPFEQAGTQALDQQQAFLGLQGPEKQQLLFDQLQESPGQQFIRKRQQRALLANASALGGLGGGNVRTALQEQAAGFAQQDIQNQFSRLSGLAGRGQDAATNIAQFGQDASRNIANLRVGQGQARASGILGVGQARQQGIKSITKGIGQFAGAGGFGGGKSGVS